MARASRLSIILCCLAEIPSYLMCGLRSRPKRSPAYVMLTLPHLLAFSLLLCWTLPCTRCSRLRTTLLFSEHCIHRRFLGNLQLVRPRLDPRPLPLLTVAAPPLWCLGHRSKRRRPPPPSTQQGRKRWGHKDKAPFSAGSGRSGGKRQGAGKKFS